MVHVKVVRVTRNGNRYQYGQLVQSVRRKSDGKPTTKVIASLGRMTDREIENFRQALRATKTGQTLVVAPQDLDTQEPGWRPPKVLRNLRYLDVAVALEAWRSCGLGDILAAVGLRDTDDVAWQDVVAALVVQRCVEPGSKLFAQRWFPTTSLPMLLSLPAAKFNNSRIHRVLDSLTQADEQLQDKLARRIARNAAGGQPFAALFLDTTDTWFVGGGPESAHRARTKEGLLRKRIGIALLCQEHGLPMRWDTFAGNQHEARPMLDIVHATTELAWARDVPLVVDRGLGSAAYVAEMLDAGVLFVTAAPRPEIPVYLGDALRPLDALTELAHDAAPDDIRRAVGVAGFHRVDDTLYLKDFNLRTRKRTRPSTPTQRATVSHASDIMQRVARFEADLISGRATSMRGLAKLHGCSSSHATRLMGLTSIPGEMREAITAGATPAAKVQDLRELAQMSPEQRREAFERLKNRAGFRAAPVAETCTEPEITVRVVAYFNPEQFAVQRRHAAESCAQIQRDIASLNERLRATPKRTDSSILATVGAILKKRSALSLFEVTVDKVDDIGPQFSLVRLTRHDGEWTRRRSLDGLAVTLTHPELQRSPEELVRLYRAKETVERDFREIKSVLELRPVRHRTDRKVQAHVSICMMALMLERTIEQRLAEAGLKTITAAAAFEALSTCHLNEIAANNRDFYAITSPTDAQRAIVRALGLESLLTRPEPADPST